eukprot:SAG31_NODE_50_length_30520_cov_89.906712_27_plen_178_part_00
MPAKPKAALQPAAESPRPPPLGPCKIYVHLIEGRSLRARDANGSSDPFVQISYQSDTKRTAKVKENLNPHWDEMLVFETTIASEYQLSATGLQIDVIDDDGIFTTDSDLIGSFRLDLGEVWKKPGHEVYRQWVGLVDCTEDRIGIQGYARLSVAIVPDGFVLNTLHSAIYDICALAI